jgi:hypothetical protein
MAAIYIESAKELLIERQVIHREPALRPINFIQL